ncbi:hypothetical protein [Clostridium saccharoperbutylacetonicum]
MTINQKCFLFNKNSCFLKMNNGQVKYIENEKHYSVFINKVLKRKGVILKRDIEGVKNQVNFTIL